MLLDTRDFGQIEYDENDIVKFIQPIYGFDEFTDYALISEVNTQGTFAWLQSIQDKDICFILAKPEPFNISYSFELDDDYTEKMGDGEFEIWLMMVIRPVLEESTVNLRSPVVINTNNNRAVQLLLVGDYPLRFPLYSN
jgi:flagellar assembly factor FliW